MCKCLGVSRSRYYYTPVVKRADTALENKVIELFIKNKKVYGTRKIKEKLVDIKWGYAVSRRRIGQIMSKYGLISKYTLKCFKPHKTPVNNDVSPNIINRVFDNRSHLEAVVSDLTYVRVGYSWNYICTILDLYNREIIGYSVGKRKDAKLVAKAFYSIKAPLKNISIFHTDRGSEFKNEVIKNIINTFDIKHSLSEKGCPYDNAVAESAYNIIKTEFVFGSKFDSTQQLEYEFSDYVNWYNNERIHGSLGYLTPAGYRLGNLTLLSS